MNANQTPRRRYVRPASTIARPMATEPARELCILPSSSELTLLVAPCDENGMDLSEMALANIGDVPEVPMSEISLRARRAAQDMFIAIDEVSTEDVLDTDFYSFNEEEPVDTDDDTDTDPDSDDNTEELEYDSDDASRISGRERLRTEQMARQADAETRDRKAREKAQAHLAKMAERKPRPVPAAAVPSPVEPPAKTKIQTLAELRNEFTAAVQAKDFGKADEIDTEIKALMAEIGKETAKAEREQAKVAEMKEAEAAEKRLAFLKGKVTELRQVLKDPSKEIGDLIAISSAVARYEHEMSEIEPKVAMLRKIREEARAKREAEIAAAKPAPVPTATPAPKATPRHCKVCGEKIEGDVMVPHFGEVERRRNICLEPDMTAEQIYGDLYFHPGCMHTPRVGIQGRAYTLGSGYKKGLEIWCNGRGRRAQVAEERKLSRENPQRASDMSRPPRQWTAAPRGNWRRSA